MAVIAITPKALPGVNAVTGVAVLAGSVSMPVTSGTDSYTVVSTGSEILLVLNTTVGALTFTITGVADPQGRTANFSMSVPASAGITTASFIVTPRLTGTLWAAAGLITIPSSNPAGLAVCALTGT